MIYLKRIGEARSSCCTKVSARLIESRACEACFAQFNLIIGQIGRCTRVVCLPRFFPLVDCFSCMCTTFPCAFCHCGILEQGVGTRVTFFAVFS